MCGQSDDPTQYDPPTPKPPTTYVLSGSKPPETEPRGSVALAVIGEMLTDAEDAWNKAPRDRRDLALLRIGVLTAARDRIAAAEAAL